jgi:Flp pilus assembly protein TadD
VRLSLPFVLWTALLSAADPVWLEDARRSFQEKRYSEAEQSVRRVLRDQPMHAEARRLLGLSLVAQSKFTREALETLRLAALDCPEARLPLAIVLMERGAAEEAARELDVYLKSAATWGVPLATSRNP